MDSALLACVIAFMHKHPELIIEKLQEATNIATFKQWLRDEAEHCRTRQLARAVDAAGIELSDESMAKLHEHDNGG